MSLGKKIIELREEMDLSRKFVADELNITYSSYSKYETDERFPDKDTLINISNYFNVSTDYLLGKSISRVNYHFKDDKSEYSADDRDKISIKGLSDDDADFVKTLVEKLKDKK